MTSLAAFSLVAGILQVLDVSFRTVKECREIYKDGSAAAHRDNGELAEALGRSAVSAVACRNPPDLQTIFVGLKFRGVALHMHSLSV